MTGSCILGVSDSLSSKLHIFIYLTADNDDDHEMILLIIILSMLTLISGYILDWRNLPGSLLHAHHSDRWSFLVEHFLFQYLDHDHQHICHHH